ncbi:MAG TPA: PBSX family phage terminase large subunit [Firmicutes bacterium]|nr:PBSX family phage terminase large subunit [Bacillota bacterium]
MTCRKKNKKKVILLKDLIISKYHDTFNDILHTHQIFTSGRAGTKSSRAAIKGILRIVDPKPGSVIAMRKFHNKLKKTIFNEYKRAIKRLGLNRKKFKITISPMQITYLPTGNTVYFTGNDSIDDTKGIIDEDRPIVLVQLDELTEFFDKGEGEDELQNIEATFIRGNDEEFVMEYYFNPPRNPKAPIMEWVNKMIQRPDCIRVHVDYRDVPPSWLGRKLIESAEILRKLDEKMYNWLWLGLCTGIDELIYYMFNEKLHVKECAEENYKEIKEFFISVDYGQMNATTFEAFGLDYKNKCVRGIDEWYWSGRDEGKQKSPSEYASEFKLFKEKIEKETNLTLKYIFIDPSAKGLSEEIKRVCSDVHVKNAKNDVPIGIARVQKTLSYQRLFISPKQKHLIAEMYLYEYDADLLDKGKEVPIKKNDHCQDALRYMIMGIWKILKRLLPMLGDDDEDEDN